MYGRAAFPDSDSSLSRACQLILTEEKGSGGSISVVLYPVPFHQGDQRFESSSLQQRVRRNRWLGNACGAGTMLHGASTVHPGMAASRPLRERRLFLTDVKERCCCPYPAVARRRTQRLQSRPPQRRADDKGGKDRDASWARGVSRLKSHTTRGDAER